MKNFIHKVQELGKKAAEIQQAIQKAPAKAAELREAVLMSATELHQIRSDVQANLHGLRVNSEERLLAAMQEINDAALLFEEAGYELSGLDLDLSLPQKLAVQLTKFEDVPGATLRRLVSNENRVTIKSILSGILKAEETAANVELSYLHLHGVIIHVGAVPMIRMCWRTEGEQTQTAAAATTQVTAQTVTPPPIPQPESPAFGSFFEQRSTPSPAPTVIPAASAVPSTSATPSTTSPEPSPALKEPAAPAESPWSRSALDRFKKMPDLSKHRR